jgi:hypothetical protein
MKKLALIAVLECFLIFSCQTERESVPAQADPSPVQAAVEESPAAIRTVPEAGPFDPQNVSRELFDSTLAEVQLFITSLNDIIHSQKYDDWMKNLSREYIDTYSSPDYLRKASEDPLFKSKKTVLTSLKDFFMYNVVPSRVNIDKVEVDDIEFITPVRVKAFTVNAKGQRLRLYELEKDENGWKVVN